MKEVLFEMIERTRKPLLLVGHSLGGAIATIALHRIIAHAKFAAPNTALAQLRALRKYTIIDEHGKEQELTDSRLSLCTFGCPRVGNRNFGSFIEAHVPNVWRVVVESDPVPDLPSSNLCGSQYKHFGTLVLLLPEGSGGLVIDPPDHGARYGVDLFLSLGCTLQRHRMKYYRKCLDEWLTKHASDRDFYAR